LAPITEAADRHRSRVEGSRTRVALHRIESIGHLRCCFPSFFSSLPLPPKCPGHPIKVLNYMMAAKPIVCFAGAAKGVRHLHDAFIVPDHDWEKMGEAIVALLRDPALAKRLGTHARETVLNNFDLRILTKKVELIYVALVAAN
jgi:glycosyltransferase involved in cell wall biosynthesis